METKEIFERMADRYDTPERIESAKIIAEAIRGQVVDGHNKKALDYGCGTGLVGLELIDVFQSMLFVDTSPRMIEQVRRKIENAHIQTAETLCCDFTTEPNPSLQVDYILLAQVLLHIKDVPLILSRLHALLHKGGHLIIVDFNKEESIVSDLVHNGFVQSELIALLKQAGFSTATAHTFYHGEKIFMNQDASLFILDAAK